MSSQSFIYRFKFIVVVRGLAGTILVYKIAAALAGSGASLDEVEAAAKFVAENIGTVGVGLEHCHVCRPSVSRRIRPKVDGRP